MLSQAQLNQLTQYRDKSYVMNILLEQHSDFYSLIKTLFNFPIIIASSIMTIMNSLFNETSKELKYTNIIVNASTVFLMSVFNNLRINEKITNYKAIQIKYNKLTHLIEDKLINEQENITKDDIKSIINEYDNLYEQIDYPFLSFIKDRIKKIYLNQKTLPNILNCEISFELKKSSDNNNTSTKNLLTENNIV